MPEVCRRNDRPTERWVSERGGGRRVTDSAVHDSSIDPARAKQSFHRPSPARLFIVFETMQYTESSPLSSRARARKNIHTTGHDSPSSPLRGASTARARMEGSTVRDDARASVPGARRGARGEASARFFCSFAVRSPFVRRSDGNRRARSFVGDRARGRAEPRSRRLSVVRAIGRGTARCGR